MYQPLRVFVLLGALITLVGLIPIVRFLVYYFMGEGDGHVQSLILGSVISLLGAFTFLIALIADLINFNRQLIEQTLEKVRRMELVIHNEYGSSRLSSDLSDKGVIEKKECGESDRN
ncbi:hypothetical protein [Alteromonas gracilis]|uniref:hypothetical protein n=1 Tax=Alteromonas gracilis TaxID=1479524 RepID=UPI0030D08291